MEAFDLSACIPWLWNGDLQRIVSSLRASEKERVYIWRKHNKKDKKKHKKGIVFRDWGGLKFGAVIFHVSHLYWLRGKDFGSC